MGKKEKVGMGDRRMNVGCGGKTTNMEAGREWSTGVNAEEKRQKI